MRYLTTINTVYEEKGKKYHFVTVAMGCEMPEEEQPVVGPTMISYYPWWNNSDN
jgi:hypothetical protein